MQNRAGGQNTRTRDALTLVIQALAIAALLVAAWGMGA